MTNRESRVNLPNGTNILALGRVRGKEKLGFVGVKQESSYLIYGLETIKENLPPLNNISDGDRKIITVRKKSMFYRGKRGRDELNQRIISNDEQLHSTRVTLFNSSGNAEHVEEQVPEADNPLGSHMQIPHKSPKLGMEVHLFKHPE